MGTRLDFNSPEFNKKTEKSFEINMSYANSIMKKMMQKVNMKVVAILAAYLIVFGLLANIYLMFTATKYYFLTALVVAVVILVFNLILKLNGGKQGSPTKYKPLKKK